MYETPSFTITVTCKGRVPLWVFQDDVNKELAEIAKTCAWSSEVRWQEIPNGALASMEVIVNADSIIAFFTAVGLVTSRPLRWFERTYVCSVAPPPHDE